jgi:predicted small metal-binding protein
VWVLVKEFSCGDVVPGCTATFTAQTEPEIVLQVAAHAREDHGMAAVPPELVTQVRSRAEADWHDKFVAPASLTCSDGDRGSLQTHPIGSG